jgi:hypothetical protein
VYAFILLSLLCLATEFLDSTKTVNPVGRFRFL